MQTEGVSHYLCRPERSFRYWRAPVEVFMLPATEFPCLPAGEH